MIITAYFDRGQTILLSVKLNIKAAPFRATKFLQFSEGKKRRRVWDRCILEPRHIGWPMALGAPTVEEFVQLC